MSRDIQSELSEIHDLSTREGQTELSSDHYTSVHLQGTSSYQTMIPYLELEKGGRYIMVEKYEPHNDHDAVPDHPPPVNQQMLGTSPSEVYNVPKPQNKATKPPFSLNSDDAEGYEKPKSVVKHKHNPGDTVFSSGCKHTEKVTVNNGIYANDLPQPLRKSYENVAGILSRNVSNSSLLPSDTPQEKLSSKVLKTYSSYDHLEKLPPQDLHDYVNIPKPGSPFNQQPLVLDSPHETPLDRRVHKTVTRVKMKPALPSKLFKPTGELSQVMQGSSEERKRRHEPLTPKGMEKKSLDQQATKGTRSQVWALDNNVNSKPPRPDNYTQLDITTMDPHSNYEQV